MLNSDDVPKNDADDYEALVALPKSLKAQLSKMELKLFMLKRSQLDSMCPYTTFDNSLPWSAMRISSCFPMSLLIYLRVA